MTSGDDLCRLLADQCRGDFVSLARYIAGGDIFGFDWHRSFWIPMFQFDLADLTVFAQPNVCTRS